MPRLRAVDPARDPGPDVDLPNGPTRPKRLDVFEGAAVRPGVPVAPPACGGGVQAGAFAAVEHEVVAPTGDEHRGRACRTAAHSAIAAGTGTSGEAILAIRRGESHGDRHPAPADSTRAVTERDGRGRLPGPGRGPSDRRNEHRPRTTRSGGGIEVAPTGEAFQCGADPGGT